MLKFLTISIYFSIAKDLKLRTRLDNRTRTLVVFSRRTGPQIVSDMINGRHPDLGEMYDLEPPGAAVERQHKLGHVFTCGSLKYALSEALSVELSKLGFSCGGIWLTFYFTFRVYESLSHVEALWIAQKFI